MQRLEELRHRMRVKQASNDQLAAILAVLGGEWHGVHDSEAILSLLRSKLQFSNRPDLNDVQSVPELVARLGVKLDHIDPALLEEARLADKEFHRKLDEDFRRASEEHRNTPEHQQFLTEERARFGTQYDEWFPGRKDS
jgi:hypothetical protein